MTATLTTDEIELRTALAKALWATRNAGSPLKTPEARLQAWQSAKPEMMKEATQVLRRLEKGGFYLDRRSDS